MGKQRQQAIAVTRVSARPVAGKLTDRGSRCAWGVAKSKPASSSFKARCIPATPGAGGYPRFVSLPAAVGRCNRLTASKPPRIDRPPHTSLRAVKGAMALVPTPAVWSPGRRGQTPLAATSTFSPAGADTGIGRTVHTATCAVDVPDRYSCPTRVLGGCWNRRSLLLSKIAEPVLPVSHGWEPSGRWQPSGR